MTISLRARSHPFVAATANIIILLEMVDIDRFLTSEH
jgi:hypothetical protein